MTLPLPLELPILPTPRERALLVLMNPDASIESFTAVVEGDPSLTAAVLRAANSAISAPVRTITSAPEGVVRLGTSAVKHLMTATLMRSQFSPMEAAGIDSDEVWRHLLGCALLCEKQAGRDEALRQSAFTAGLLHDIGRLAMAAQAPTRYRRVVEAAQAGLDSREVEFHLFGIDHAEFGQRITERWNLPDEITEAIGQHHETPEAAGQAGPTRHALSVARALVGGLGIGDGAHRPDRPDATAEEHPLIVALGGRAEFMNSIRWFRDSTTARRAA